MMPLTMAKQGETVTIRKLTGKDEVRQHLAELGLVVAGEGPGVDDTVGVPNIRAQARGRAAARRAVQSRRR